MSFCQNSVPEQRHRRPDRQLAVELDRDGVHRDGADDAPWLAPDADLGTRHVAPEAVRVADRDDPDPGRPLGHEVPAVAGALPRAEQPHLREPASPVERGLEPIFARVAAEGR